jgi:plastocyanin
MRALALLSTMFAAATGLIVVVGGTAAPGPCQPGDELVDISGYAYSPSPRTVITGTTVCWTNKDSVSHTVTAAGAFDSGSIDPNGSFRQAFPTAGTFMYECAVPGHVMSGQIVVTGSPPPPPPPGPPPSPPPAPPPPPPAPPPPHVHPLSVSGLRFSVERQGSRRMLVARARVTRPASARLRLMRRTRTVASARKRWATGANAIRATLPRAIATGRWTAVLQVGSKTYKRSIRIG